MPLAESNPFLLNMTFILCRSFLMKNRAKMKTRKEYYKCTVFICIHIDTGIRFDLELQARVHPLHFLHALFVVRPEKMRTFMHTFWVLL